MGLCLALAFQLITAGPRHFLLVMPDLVDDFSVHVEHHHPICMGCRLWLLVSSVGCWVVVLVTGLVWPSALGSLLAFLFLAAASAALALEAWVSRRGSVGCWLAKTVALAIHLAFCTVSVSWALICCLILKGTLWASTARLA